MVRVVPFSDGITLCIVVSVSVVEFSPIEICSLTEMKMSLIGALHFILTVVEVRRLKTVNEECVTLKVVNTHYHIIYLLKCRPASLPQPLQTTG